MSRRGNPPEGFRSSKTICGNGEINSSNLVLLSSSPLIVAPTTPFPDRPPLMVKDGLIVLLWIKHFKTQKKPLQRLTLCKGFFIMFFLKQPYSAMSGNRLLLNLCSASGLRLPQGLLRAVTRTTFVHYCLRSAYFLSPTSTFSAPSTTSTVSTVSGARSFVTIVVATSVSTLCCIKRFRGLAPYTGS